jgi:hypothetical protein
VFDHQELERVSESGADISAAFAAGWRTERIRTRLREGSRTEQEE